MQKKKQKVSDDLLKRLIGSKRIVRELKAMRKELNEELRNVEIAIMRRTITKNVRKKS